MKLKFEHADKKGIPTGEVIQEWEFTKSQEKFWTSDKKFVLFSGGYGCGKSLMLTLKAIELSMKYANNYILMGRLTYPELRDSLIKEFFTICPDYLVADYLKAEGRVVFPNKSEIVFRHLDNIAEMEIRSMNLGAFFIDQAEEIPQPVFMGLRGRLRRDSVADGDRRGYLSCNPALTWLFGEFKQNPKPEYEVIEASTLENEKNLPAEYIEDLLKYPESLKKQYVYGIWDADLLADRVVFAREYQERLKKYAKDPIRTDDNLEIYVEFKKGHNYQMGVDPAEGLEKGDFATVTITDLCCLEEVASFAGKIPPDFLAEKVETWANLYSDKNLKCLIIPEMNSIGLALVNVLMKKEDLRIYKREEFDKKTGKRLEKVGWRTTRQSKPLLVSHFNELLRLLDPKVRSKKTLEEFKTFVYSEESKLNGIGAEVGFHDDRIVSLLLSFWQKAPVTAGSVVSPELKAIREDSPFTIVNGKMKIRPGYEDFFPKKETVKSWLLG